MPASKDPEKRARQLANLPNLRGEPTAGSWKPGDAPHLVHGERTRRPQAGPEWSPAVAAAVADLEGRVGAELRQPDGELFSWALPSIEAVAVQRVATWRAERRCADLEARGALKGEDVDLASRVAERYHRALEREALTLRSRLAASAGVADLAQLLAERHREAGGG